MMLLNLIGITVVLGQAPVSHIDAQSLGRLRASFPELALSDPRTKAEKASVVTTQFEEYPTEVYFPSGRADIRFYINGPNEGGRDPGVEAYLICEKKVGSKAVLAWTLSLKKVDNNDYILPPVMKDKGAILLMLYRRRLRPIWKGKNVKMIGDEMVKAKELAGYRMMSNHFDTLWYFFVDRYGNASIPEEADFARFDFPGGTTPYPISSQELKELKD